MDYRNEIKYLVSETQLVLLENRIRNLIQPDRHAGADGTYQIRSLYFDDFENTYYRENEMGTDPREKFRIRIYNGDPGRISLELKKKQHGMTQKLSCLLTEEQCRELMAGRPLPADPSYPPVLQKMNLLMKTRLLKPKVIVEYDRTPFVEKLGNTRVTLDRNIRSSNAVASFLEKRVPARPIMPAGKQILEVKYDEFLPDYLYRNLQLSHLRQTTFSKYYLCRRYSLSGIRA
ncbi:VTC domain-containing protein [Lachnoclostridium sp. An131]|uniref:polyphosphate polymerase domain-containing protein n=1 Tax=Lachnoclostridium sp. An131 TaxID=1965555 RepID=UPI000B38687A|nr:polyphosphate polymerase domain-containing protein [Lachnoclostridium sp. An131]OUQ28657.1 VTC domain-containing protein [Lachnoclostridium sp. An131]